MLLRKSILALLFALLSAGLILLATGIYLGPDRTINWLRTVMPEISGTALFDTLVTPGKVVLIFVYLSGLIIFILALILLVFNRLPDVRSFLRECGIQAVRTFRVLASPGMAISLFVPLSAAVYYAATLPVSQDEALTYLFFTSRNALVAFAYYPFPNNHILHSILTTLTKDLPFPVLFNLRLPAILVQLMAWLVALRVLSRLYHNKYAILAVSLASMLFLNLYYTYESRGYALVNFSFVTTLGCVYAICAGIRNRWLWHFLALFSAIGFAAMPSFLYPFVTLHVILLWYIRKLSAAQIFSGLGTIFLTSLFYAPAIIVNGFSAFSGNAYVAPAPRNTVVAELPTFLGQLLSEIAGIHWIWVAAVLVIATAYLLLLGPREKKTEAAIWIISIPICIIAHSVIPFPRTFVYLGLLVSLLLSSTALPLIQHWPVIRITALGILLQIILLVHFQQTIEPYEERDPQINFTASHIIDSIAAPGKTYLCSGALLGTNLLFHIKANNLENSSVIFNEKPVNADTCTTVDFVIAGYHLDRTREQRPIFQTRYYAVYRTKP
jgi:hypothetical protein